MDSEKLIVLRLDCFRLCNVPDKTTDEIIANAAKVYAFLMEAPRGQANE